MASHRKYTNLDGLRGVAAICVVLYHFSPLFSASTIDPSAYLAVDFFFVLSGFVVAYAYDARLRQGLGLTRFAGIRLLRLYPLYFFGSALGFLYLLMRWRVFPADAVPPNEALLRPAAAAGFVPQVLEGHQLYPLDPAAWSLFYELLANFAYCALFGWLTTRRLTVVTVLASLAIAAVALTLGSLDVGSGPALRSFLGGGSRVVFSFCAGALVYRLRGWQPAWLLRLAAQARTEVLVVVVLATFAADPSGPARAVYDIACVLLLFPAIIMMGVHAPVPRNEWPVYEFLGQLSYPLYILHTPLILILSGLYKIVMHTDPLIGRPWSGVALTLAVLLCVPIAERAYDRPLRRLIGNRMALTGGLPAVAPPAVAPPAGASVVKQSGTAA